MTVLIDDEGVPYWHPANAEAIAYVRRRLEVEIEEDAVWDSDETVDD